MMGCRFTQYQFRKEKQNNHIRFQELSLIAVTVLSSQSRSLVKGRRFRLNQRQGRDEALLGISGREQHWTQINRAHLSERPKIAKGTQPGGRVPF